MAKHRIEDVQGLPLLGPPRRWWAVRNALRQQMAVAALRHRVMETEPTPRHAAGDR